MKSFYSVLVEEKCKELSKIMPFMFEGEGDYVELLFPKGILMENAFISKLRKNLEESKEEGIIPVELIGWLYQFYNAQKKDEVFEALKKNVKLNKDSIPAATQLFTPKWIVKYMAENSIGKLALENFNISQETKDKWKYFIDNTVGVLPLANPNNTLVDAQVPLKLEDIKVIDPCMGSGHMLVYSFELLFDIYVDLGWTPREAVLSILQNNIYGLDIDDRAAQLASFALIMTARTKFNRLFKTLESENIIPHTHSIKETNELDPYVEGLIKDNKLNELYYLIDTFKDAKELGSTIKLSKFGRSFIDFFTGDDTL